MKSNPAGTIFQYPDTNSLLTYQYVNHAFKRIPMRFGNQGEDIVIFTSSYNKVDNNFGVHSTMKGSSSYIAARHGKRKRVLEVKC